MKILLNLTGDTTNWLKHSRVLAAVVKHICECQVEICREYIRQHKVPPLYLSGVRYAEEPVNILKLGSSPSERVEEFACIPAVIERGWGDCDDLAPWRCAELRFHERERAKIKIDWRTHPVTRQKVYHVLVRRGDGSVEDPSAKLGMR